MHFYKNLIFDCDGVVFDSNHSKIKAVEEVLKKLGNQSAVIDRCVYDFSKNFGRTRHEHFAHFKRHCGVQGELHDLINLYSERVEDIYMKASFTEGFVEKFKRDNRRKFLVSASDQEQLRRAFAYREDISFEVILGGPVSKEENLLSLLNQYDFPHEEACYVGDSIKDMNAAQEAGLTFIAYTPFSNTPKQLAACSASLGHKVIGSWDEFL